MRSLFFALSLALAVGTTAAPTAASSAAPNSDNEVCASLLPGALRVQVLREFPGYRFMRLDDYSADDIQSESQYHGGSTCLAVASADYFGDHRKAYAFMLISDASDALVLVAHQMPDKHWKTVKLGDAWHVNYIKGAFNYFVNTTPPGSYSDQAVEDGADPKDMAKNLDWVQDITSSTPGVAIGIIEAGVETHFFKDGRWVYTTISD